MQDNVVVNGLIIKAEPFGEYDRRLVILTKERGKISAFAKGARKPNSRFVAGTNLFVFGEFRLYEGRNSYSVNDVKVTNYFEYMRDDVVGAYYGMYFLEVADYYTRENNDEVEMLKLLYQSLRALGSASLENRLVRAIFEIKSVVINGEYPGVRDSDKYNSDTIYAVNYIVSSPVEKLYNFTVSEEVLEQLCNISQSIMKKMVPASFNSLIMLSALA